MKNFVIPNLDTPDAERLSDYLNSSIEAFSNITGVPVTYFSRNNEILKTFKSNDKICRIFEIYSHTDSSCRKALCSAGQFASRLGEPYIFMCRAGLANIAVSLILDNEFAGYFIAGPVVMGELRSSTKRSFMNLNSLNDTNMSIARMFAENMHVYQPEELSQLALLLYNTILTSVSGSSDYNTRRMQYSEQSRTASDTQNTKREHFQTEYPYDLEKVLISNVNDGQVDLARENLKKMLDTFSVLESGDLESIKAKCLWFFAIIIRLANENNNVNQLMDTDMDIISKLSEAETFADLSKVADSIIVLITKNMLSSIYSGRSQIVAKALQFINKNYKEKLLLKDIEANLHVNASYFSTLFKQEMGVTFTDYLNSLKIDHACDLLRNTNLSIIDVSMSTGFDDQSYFTKVFKKSKGMTPKAYRAANIKKDDA